MITVQQSAENLVPRAVLQRTVDRAYFQRQLSRYVAMDNDDLHHATEVCLRNLGRLNDEALGPDGNLRLVLVPELWERLRPGACTSLRRLTSNLAEYQGDQSSIFASMLSPESRASLRDSAADLRQRIAAAAHLDVRALVEQTRFAIAGSCAANMWPPDYPVYEPGFTYRLVPVVAWRVLTTSRHEHAAS